MFKFSSQCIFKKVLNVLEKECGLSLKYLKVHALGKSHEHKLERRRNPSKYKIRLGEHDITSDSEPTQKDFTIIKTLFYPDFKLDVAYHDLAIVKLSGGLSSVLRDADVRIFDSSVCNKSYSTLRDYKMLWPRGIKSNFLLCAGARNGGIDSCQGDSGGPLVYRRNKHVELIGIVSKGFGCGLQEFPGLYITIRTYLLWICEMILRD
ncbi:Serine protease 29 [Armadillidium vulgare]|nr:Serine protease 29 [Armadillidium vulgare]